MTAEYDLHCFAQSGNAYKAALMLSLCGANWRPLRIAFFAGETRSPQFRQLNVMGEAPVLVHHRKEGDFTLSQSGAILLYLARRLGRFGPKNEAEEYEILRWILFDNHKLSSYTATARFMMHFQKKTDDPAAKFIHARAVGAWKVLEAHLADRDFAVADRPTIADLSMCGYLFWPDEIGVDWNEYPAIKAWLARIAGLPGWRMPGDLMPSGLDPQTATA
jgi:glutathione S-transferase